MNKAKHIILISLIFFVVCLSGCIIPNLEKVTSITETTTGTTKSQEQLVSDIKDNFKYILENGFPGTELTKFELTKSNDRVYLDIGYNTNLLSDDAMYKEMFDIVSILAKNTDGELCVDISSTSSLGDVIETYTGVLDIDKIRNFEMDFSDWLKATNK